MRNKYPGTCYRCGKRVEAGAGHFERHNGGWRTQHAQCAIDHRKEYIVHKNAPGGLRILSDQEASGVRAFVKSENGKDHSR